MCKYDSRKDPFEIRGTIFKIGDFRFEIDQWNRTYESCILATPNCSEYSKLQLIMSYLMVKINFD